MTVVKENGNYLQGEAYEAVVDAVEDDRASCEVGGYTVNILEVSTAADGEKIVKVKVEGIDE